MSTMLYIYIASAVVVGLTVVWWLLGWRHIRSNEQGVIEKNWGMRELPPGQLIALKGERGYQARLLAPGWVWVPFIIYSVRREPIPEIGSSEIGLVVAQVGITPPVGMRTAEYKNDFGDFDEVNKFLENGGQKGKQRRVLRPGTYRGIHPVGFLVLTPHKIYGIPLDPELKKKADRGDLSLADFDLTDEQLTPVVVRSRPAGPQLEVEEHADPRTARRDRTAERREHMVNMMGVVTSHEGPPLQDGQLAGRLTGYADVDTQADPKQRINILLNNQNTTHQAYQDFEAFLKAGGKAGLQHDPVTEGTYYLNPWLVGLEQLPVLHVLEGEVAVIKSKVGLVERDISGAEFKFGSIVLPGHRGLWSEPIRTGSWLLNPRCYEATLVPTKILTLYWADNMNAAGKLDEKLMTIKAKSRDGFEFSIELQVQIHISDVQAPRVISMVGSVQNLVNEVLQSAVGNYFRNKIQSMQATEFIQERDRVQEEAFKYIEEKLSLYEVETLGVFLQDIGFPEELAEILKQREIAAQEIETFKRQKDAQDQRIATENARGIAERQVALATSKVDIEIRANEAEARKKEADGTAYAAETIGKGEGSALKHKGEGVAAGLKAQRDAVGEQGTVVVNVVKELINSGQPLVPEVLSLGGGGGGGLESVFGVLTDWLRNRPAPTTPSPTEPTAPPAAQEGDIAPYNPALPASRSNGAPARA